MTFWYDPMVNTLGMPGYDGGVNARLDASFSQAPAQNAAVGSYGQNVLDNIYGEGFGALTGRYAQAVADSYATMNPSGPGGVPAGGMVDPTPNVGAGASSYPGLRNPFVAGSGSAQRWDAQYGGGIGSDAARAPDQPAIQPQFNAPMSQGWTPNEGAPVPQQTYQPPMGEFRPQSYGWDHNEGAPLRNPFTPGSGSALRWEAQYGGGSQYLNPAPMGPAQSFQPTFNDRFQFPQQPGFNDRFQFPYAPPKIESPYGPGGYPPMTPPNPTNQSGLRETFGMNLANNVYGDPFQIIPGGG